MENHRLRVLIVDDNPVDRELIQIYLHKVSTQLELFEVETAGEALARVQTDQIDCVLSDYQMPGMDGMELLQTLRREDHAVPFIFLTGQGNEKLAAEALRSGADDYFTKERSFAHYERLFNSIQRVVDFHRMRIQKKRMEEEHVRHLRELQALHELGESMRSDSGIQQMAHAAVEGILSAVSPDFAMLFTRSGGELELVASGPANSPFCHSSTPTHRVGECLCGLAVIEKKALYSVDIRKDARCTWTECREAGLVSFSALPLIHKDEVIGVIGLASASVRDFSLQLPFLEALAATISGGTALALKFEYLKTENRRLQERLTSHN